MRLAIAILFLLGTGCGASPEETQGFRGGTMGTSYQVTYSGTDAQVEEDQAAVEDLLAQVNQSLSTYIESSLISEINSSTDTTLWHTIDLHFERVFDRSKTLHQQTNGAFNPAVGPLVGAWGVISLKSGEKFELEGSILPAGHGAWALRSRRKTSLPDKKPNK